MSRFIDITGNRYGKLFVVERLENTQRGVTVWSRLSWFITELTN